jgi:hypothetical protein
MTAIAQANRAWPAMKIDHVKQRVAIGTGIRARYFSFPTPQNTTLQSIAYDPEDLTVTVRFVGGERAVAELHDRSSGDQRRGRPIVYLDQCHWSALSNLRHASSKVKESERIAASRLTALAADDKVILPISSGHLSETGELYGAKRRHLASTMLRYSRGWQMRDPIAVREAEIRGSVGMVLKGADAHVDDVFTLEPGARFSGRLAPYQPSITLDESSAALLQSLVSISAIYDGLMDPERVERGDVDYWAEANRKLAQDIDNQGLSRQKRDFAIHESLLKDIRPDIDRAAAFWSLSPEAAAGWEAGADEKIRALPFTGLYGEARAQKLREVNFKWSENDLTDIIYLSCAAGYADVVIAEKRAASYLGTSAGKLGRGLNIFPSIESAIECVESLVRK